LNKYDDDDDDDNAVPSAPPSNIQVFQATMVDNTTMYLYHIIS